MWVWKIKITHFLSYLDSDNLPQGNMWKFQAHANFQNKPSVWGNRRDLANIRLNGRVSLNLNQMGAFSNQLPSHACFASSPSVSFNSIIISLCLKIYYILLRNIPEPLRTGKWMYVLAKRDRRDSALLKLQYIMDKISMTIFSGHNSNHFVFFCAWI